MAWLAKTAYDLLVIFRGEVSDIVNDVTVQEYARLWKDAEIYGYMTEACDALARDTELLYEVSSIGYLAGDLTVPLPPHILKIRSVRMVTANKTLRPNNANGPRTVYRDYGIVSPSSMFGVSGTPLEYVRDYDIGALRLVPTPIVADTLELQSSVTIPDALGTGDDVPFTEAIDQRLVLEYMKSRAYRKQDAETQDFKRADDAKAAYDLGSLKRAEQIRKYRRAAGVVQYQF